MLARRGKQRRVKVRVPSFLAAVEIAARSDLIMTLPSSLARTAADMRRFAMAPPPLALGGVPMSLAWHARHQDFPAPCLAAQNDRGGGCRYRLVAGRRPKNAPVPDSARSWLASWPAGSAGRFRWHATDQLC